MIVATFQKINFDYPMHRCFVCQGRPWGIMTFKLTGEEVRICEKCYLSRRKGRKIRSDKGKTALKPKQTILDQLHTGKNQEMPIVGVGYD